MKIRTNPSKASRGELFTIVLWHFVRQYWWLVLVICIFVGFTAGSYIGVALFLLSAGFQAASVWLYVSPKHNRWFYLTSWVELDEEFIEDRYADGSVIKVNWSSIVKVIRTKKHYLIYYSSNHLLVIPLASFSSEDDARDFRAFLKLKGWEK